MNPMNLVKTVLPWIGTALGGPLGQIAASSIGNVLGLSDTSIGAVKTVLSGMSPEKLAEYRAADQSLQLEMAKLGYTNLLDLEKLNASVIVEVNKTMQVEAGSEHWPSYSWRPFIGFSFGLYICSLWILPLFHVVPVTLTTDTVLAIGGILGVASWFRGKAQADPTVQNTSQISQKG